MRDAMNHQLRRLDEALLALLDERARLLLVHPGPARERSDLLRRHVGCLSPAAIHEFFDVVERLCGPARAAAEADQGGQR